MGEPSPRYRAFARPALDELKRKSLRGGAVVAGAQVAKLALQMGTVMVLARLLSPGDFGLTGMAATFTGFLGCPSSGDLRQLAVAAKGGSGSSVVDLMRHAVGAASDDLRWFGV